MAEAQQPIVRAGSRLIASGYRVVVEHIRNNGVVCRLGDRVFLFTFASIEKAVADGN